MYSDNIGMLKNLLTTEKVNKKPIKMRVGRTADLTCLVEIKMNR